MYSANLCMLGLDSLPNPLSAPKAPLLLIKFWKDCPWGLYMKSASSIDIADREYRLWAQMVSTCTCLTVHAQTSTSWCQCYCVVRHQTCSNILFQCCSEWLLQMFCSELRSYSLGLLLHTEAPIMVPNGVDFAFPFFLSFFLEIIAHMRSLEMVLHPAAVASKWQYAAYRLPVCPTTVPETCMKTYHWIQKTWVSN